jgi:tetratricopeptide (TPR) repeat protein
MVWPNFGAGRDIERLNSMSVRTNTNTIRFIGFLTSQSILEAARGIVRAASSAHAARRFSEVGELGSLLISANLSPAWTGVGYHYAGIATMAAGEGDLREAAELFENALTKCATTYKARVFLSLTALANFSENYTAELRLSERLAGNEDFFVRAEALRHLAIIRSREGDHRGALRILETLESTYRYHPNWQHYLNSLAVELCEAGRPKEAQKAISMALRSPVASAFPEFKATEATISEKLSETPGKLLAFTPRVDLDRIRRESAYYIHREIMQPNYPIRHVMKLQAQVEARANA